MKKAGRKAYSKERMDQDNDREREEISREGQKKR